MDFFSRGDFGERRDGVLLALRLGFNASGSIAMAAVEGSDLGVSVQVPDGVGGSPPATRTGGSFGGELVGHGSFPSDGELAIDDPADDPTDGFNDRDCDDVDGKDGDVADEGECDETANDGEG